MRVRTILVSLALFGSLGVCLGADLIIGTWKLNEPKSKLAPTATKNQTVVFAAVGDSVMITVDGVNSEGKPVHNEWTGRYDGKDYPVSGDPGSDARALTRVNDRTIDFSAKKNGKVTTTGQIVVAADGKTRTVTTSTIDAKGNKVESMSFYDKQ